jgi:mannose-6-phosphate isomerase-like protein (cupin superfamily)
MAMSKFTVIKFKDIPPQHFGQDPKDVDVRFYRNQLGMSGGGMSVMKLGTGITSNAHKHKQQEETYLVIEGEVEIKLDDEVIKLRKFDALRVPKETFRALRNTGKKPAVVIAFGTPNTGPGDAIDKDNFWD